MELLLFLIFLALGILETISLSYYSLISTIPFSIYYISSSYIIMVLEDPLLHVAQVQFLGFPFHGNPSSIYSISYNINQ